MQFVDTKLPGVVLVELEPFSDERGYFARTFCRDEFTRQGLQADVMQCNTSYNKRKGTFRGMHFQRTPNGEAKLVRCTAGAIFDVVLDLRSDSPTYLQWAGFELTAEEGRAVYIPEGFAHGFQTLAEDTVVFYQMFNFFAPESAGGVRWNDPAFDIQLPLPVSTLSDKDAAYPDYSGDLF